MYNGTEKLTYGDTKLDSTILDFWSWAYSDLIRNVNRGAFAEYIVREAMNSKAGISSAQEECRISMDAYDLLSPEGIRVEVKSSAYIQSWKSDHPSKISFRIAPAKAMDAFGNYSVNSQYGRHSDVYVFCVWTATSREQSILDLSLWDFYVISTRALDQKVPNQQTISFNSLLSLQPRKVNYFNLYEAITKSFKEAKGDFYE